MGSQCVDQSTRIGRGLRHSHADVGSGHERGVAQDHRSRSERHTRRLKIEDGLYERQSREANDLGKLRRKQSVRVPPHRGDHIGSNPGRWNGQFVPDAVDVRQEICQSMVGIRRAVPNKIEAALADIHLFVGAGDGITEHLFAGREAEGKPVAQFCAGPRSSGKS